MNYFLVAFEILGQILSVVGRCFLILIACGFAGATLFFIELTISYALPRTIIDKNWFSNLVIISCLVVGVIAAILCGKALF